MRRCISWEKSVIFRAISMWKPFRGRVRNWFRRWDILQTEWVWTWNSQRKKVFAFLHRTRVGRISWLPWGWCRKSEKKIGRNWQYTGMLRSLCRQGRVRRWLSEQLQKLTFRLCRWRRHFIRSLNWRECFIRRLFPWTKIKRFRSKQIVARRFWENTGYIRRTGCCVTISFMWMNCWMKRIRILMYWWILNVTGQSAIWRSSRLRWTGRTTTCCFEFRGLDTGRRPGS